MIHWLDKVVEILNSGASDLRILANIAGEDAQTFYVGADLSKVDIRGQDLSGMDFTGANLRGAIFDLETKIDPQFDPRLKWVAVQETFHIGPQLQHLVSLYIRRVERKQIGWGVKSLISYAGLIADYEHDRAQEWLQAISQSKELRRFFLEDRHRKISVSLGLSYADHARSFHYANYRDGGFIAMILMGVLMTVGLEPPDLRRSVIDHVYNSLGGKLGLIGVRTPGMSPDEGPRG